MRVYIAGPMRGIPLYNFPAFDAAAQRLRDAGHDVVNPAELDRLAGFDERVNEPSETFIREAMDRDLSAICHCDAIALLPGWHASRGVAVELALAKFFNLKILDATTGEPFIEPITAEAQRITTRDRRDVYGHPAEDFERIAGMWSAIIGTGVTAHHVGLCQIAVKIGRLCKTPYHRDSLTDIAGYANCLDMIRQKEEAEASR